MEVQILLLVVATGIIMTVFFMTGLFVGYHWNEYTWLLTSKRIERNVMRDIRRSERRQDAMDDVPEEEYEPHEEEVEA